MHNIPAPVTGQIGTVIDPACTRDCLAGALDAASQSPAAPHVPAFDAW